MGKRSKLYKSILLILILLLIIIIAAGYYLFRQWQEERKARQAYYTAFNIDIPKGYKYHGIDVSRHQSIIYWPSVKRMKVRDVQVDFAFIKATEGVSGVDKLYRRNWQKAGEAGIRRGAYHFFIATKSGALQAQNFIKTVKLSPGDLPPVLDIEELYGASTVNMQKEILIWLQTIEKHYSVKPILYTYVDFYEKQLGNNFDGYPLWIAHYFQKDKPRIKRNWHFWQHSESGSVNGITTKVDFNVFSGDSLAFNRILIK